MTAASRENKGIGRLRLSMHSFDDTIFGLRKAFQDFCCQPLDKRKVVSPAHCPNRGRVKKEKDIEPISLEKNRISW